MAAAPKKSVSIPVDDDGTLQGRAHRTAEDIREHQRTVSDRGTFTMARGRTADGEPLAAEFPAQYFPDKEKRDQAILMKQRLLQGPPGGAPTRPLGDAQLTKEDIQWFQEKEEVKARIIFDQWFAQLFDTRDINKLRLAQEINPDYYKQREEEIDRQAAIQKKLAMIKLRGVVDLDDLKFLYALQTGDVTLRNVPLYNLDDKSELDLAYQRAKYKKGIFNPTRWSSGLDSSEVPKTLGRGIFGANVIGPAGLPELGNAFGGGGLPGRTVPPFAQYAVPAAVNPGDW